MFEFLVVFEDDIPKDAMQLIVGSLEDNGVKVDVCSSTNNSNKNNSKNNMRCSAESHALFQAAEETYLVKKRFDGIYAPFNAKQWKQHLSSPSGECISFTSAEKSELVHHLLHKTRVSEKHLKLLPKSSLHQPLIVACQQHKYIREIFPLHDPEEQMKLWRKGIKSWVLPIQDIRDYYGDEIALYFAWMQYYCFWLLFPCVAASFLWYFCPAELTVDNHPYICIFSFGVVLWAWLFIRYWQRQSATLAWHWRTLDMNDSEEEEEARVEYYGDVMVSPITGRNILYYPVWKRRVKQVISLMITLVMIALVLMLMFASLNLQGYIRDETSFFHISMFHEYAVSGAIFDSDSIGGYIPPVLHSCVILGVNLLYRNIAQRLTQWENYRTETEYMNALCVKRFIFEALDCYLHLFYVAFYWLDVVQLKKEIVSLFMVDEGRRLLTETLLPWALVKIKKKHNREEAKDLRQEMREEYEGFDDYLEMTIQFGYVVLFATALPAAAIFALISNLLELRSDFLKLTFIYRRPLAVRTGSIGVWLTVLQVIAFVSILSNLFIFAFSSEQMLQWMPWLFDDLPNDQHQMRLGSGRYVIYAVFGMEHLMMLIVLVIHALVPKIPLKIRLEKAKEQYQLRTATLQKEK